MFQRTMDTKHLLTGDYLEYVFKSGNLASSGLECNVKFS